jgi:S1-C subfamily serine protease
MPRRPFAAPSIATACLIACSSLAARPPALAAQTPAVAPTRATVFIRLLGDLEIVRPADQTGAERRVREADVELGTGSGVLISPLGHVLTAAHVISADNRTATVNGVRVEVRETVRRIEVHLPPGDSGPAPPGPFEASVLAVDQALDLAILSVSAVNPPFLDLGDSDALAVGDPLEAVGFPFGERVEIGRPADALPAAPAPSVSRGNLSAFRGEAEGDRRYLQLTTVLNPGNSGGPVVDADGYVVAIANSVMRSRSGVGTGVGFGVSVNLAKHFLESWGVDSALRARRMSPGPVSPIEGKGLRVALPVGMSDTSPVRSRVDTGGFALDGVTLRIDRVVSPWPATRIAEALASGRAFEPFSPSSSTPRRPADALGGRLILGRAIGTLTDGTQARIDYAIADLGVEKVVARFIGPPYQLAYNTSIVRAALRQLEADTLRAPRPVIGGPTAWVARTPGRGTSLDRVTLPSGWMVEAVGPLPCRGLPEPADVVSASPPTDFTVALRAGVLRGAGLTAQQASAACGTPARDDASAYVRDYTFLGAPYRVEGRFLAAADGLLQLEYVSLADAASDARAVFLEWAGNTGR